MSLNRICIQGRMTKDPELRYTNSGKAVTSFTLAVDRDRKDGGVDYVDCTAWDKTAEFAVQYFGKGSQAVVDGRLQFRDWKDKNGNNRRNAEVQVEHIYFCGSKKDAAEGSYGEPTDYAEPGNGFQEISDSEECLPF